MRLPNRKPGKYTFPTFDPHMTQAKLDEMQQKLSSAEKKLPNAIKAVQQYGENGDFSENAEYQIAKGRLRGLNRSIEELRYQINHAVIIKTPINSHTIQIGHTVTVQINGVDQTFTILGPTETNPTAGIISYLSPVGATLLGKAVGDTVMGYTVIAID